MKPSLLFAALLVFPALAAAQGYEAHSSTLYHCVDREGIKRLRNYPCSPSERDVDELQLRSRTVTFVGGAQTGYVPPAPSSPSPSGSRAASKERVQQSLQQAKERVQRRNASDRERVRNACGEYPHITTYGDKRDVETSKAMDAWQKCALSTGGF